MAIDVSAGAALRIRSPAIAWFFIISHSTGSSSLGFCRIASGTATLPDVVQVGGTREVVELVAGDSHLATDLHGEACHLVEVVAQLRLALFERLQQGGGRLVADGRALAALLARVQALVGEAHGSDRVVPLAWG